MSFKILLWHWHSHNKQAKSSLLYVVAHTHIQHTTTLSCRISTYGCKFSCQLSSIWKCPGNGLDYEKHRTATSSITVNIKSANSGKGRGGRQNRKKTVLQLVIKIPNSWHTGRNLHSVQFSICMWCVCNLRTSAQTGKQPEESPILLL